MATNMHGHSPVPCDWLERNRRTFRWLLAAVVATAGCGSSSVTYLAGPTATCEASLPSTQLAVDSLGGRFNTSVSAAGECSWTASSDASWIQVTPQTGQGNEALIVTVSANSDTRSRAGMILIAGQNLLVVQEAAAIAPPPPSTPSSPPSEPAPPSTPSPPPSEPSTPPPPTCSYTISPSSANIGKNGGTKTFDVKTTSACNWTASTADSWITLLTASGRGNGTVRYDVQKQTGKSDERTGAITVAGLVFRVTQKD
jgi:BACON domain-containing protein